MTRLTNYDVKTHGLGFFEGLETELPVQLTMAAAKALALSGQVTTETEAAQMRTLMITQVFHELTYSDFQNLSEYFFIYQRGLASHQVIPLEADPDLYHLLKSDPEDWMS